MPMATYASCVSNDGLKAWYKLEGGVIDSSGANNGVRYNFTDGYTTGRFGQALSFDPTAEQFISVPDDSSLNFTTGNYTIEFWMKTNATDNPDFLGKMASGLGWWFYIDTNKVVFDLNDDSNAFATSVTSINNDTWFYIVGERIGNESNIYVNGVLEDTDDAGLLGDTDNAEPFAIGYVYYGSETYYNGSIDEIRIWNRALSQAEITDLYASNIICSSATNYTELDLNHTSYKRCLANNTYQMEFNNYNGIWYNRSSLEWCETGCDNTTKSCQPEQAQTSLILFGVIVAIVIIGWVFIRWAKR